MAFPARAAPHRTKRMYDWSLRGIRWGAILRYQHWGGLLLFIPAVIITGISHWTFQDRPVVRQALLYDATISLLPAGEAINNGLATALNWICMVVAVLVIELLYFFRHHSLTVALAGILHQLWCCAINFVIVITITEITKPFSGRLRPDFLSRCQPAAAIDPSSNFTGVVGGSHAAALGPLHLGQLAGDCTNPDKEAVNDGRLSFPSGHASNSMSLAWYTALYIMWSMYLRQDAPYPRRLFEVRTFVGRLFHEVLHALAYGFILLALCLSWFIGMTRFWDNVHNVSDIIGGFLLAIIFSTPFVIKAIGLHTALRDNIDGHMDKDTTVLSPADDDDDDGPRLPVTAAPAGVQRSSAGLGNGSMSSLGGGHNDVALEVNPLQMSPRQNNALQNRPLPR